MVVRLVLGALVVSVAIIGCGSGGTSETPPATEKAAIADSKAAWNDEKVNAFKKAHNEEGRMTPGQRAAAGGQDLGQASAK